MATQGGNVYSLEQINNVRREYGHEPLSDNFGDHVRGVMDAATDDVKSVVMPVVETASEVIRSTGRDVALFIAGGAFTLGVIVVAHFI